MKHAQALVMFPVLLYFYRGLAIREEIRSEFGEAWERYAATKRRFIPRHQPPRPRSASSALREAPQYGR